jgi:hypothetical protein
MVAELLGNESFKMVVMVVQDCDCNNTEITVYFKMVKMANFMLHMHFIRILN